MTTSASQPNGIRIRPAERADLLEVVRIERTSFPQPWPLGAFEQHLGKPGFLIAASGPTIAGYVVADTTPNPDRQLGHIKDLAVHPEYRDRGLGSRLLSRGLGVLAARGVGLVKLEVRPSNERAQSLYTEHGFQVHHRVPSYYADGEDALVLVTDLTGR
ncbi:MAG: ribosomal protein S18-alanine N-acetyltransferase [Halobacteriales archaeon]|nr:ribosomal protein S18-alanine N-acetyltransferase [Halobacteriales archaeon]